MSPDDMLSVPEAAEILGVSPKTVSRLIDGKRLRANRPSPRKTQVRRGDLDAYRKKTWTMPAAA